MAFPKSSNYKVIHRLIYNDICYNSCNPELQKKNHLKKKKTHEIIQGTTSYEIHCYVVMSSLVF